MENHPPGFEALFPFNLKDVVQRYSSCCSGINLVVTENINVCWSVWDVLLMLFAANTGVPTPEPFTSLNFENLIDGPLSLLDEYAIALTLTVKVYIPAISSLTLK